MILDYAGNTTSTFVKLIVTVPPIPFPSVYTYWLSPLLTHAGRSVIVTVSFPSPSILKTISLVDAVSFAANISASEIVIFVFLPSCASIVVRPVTWVKTPSLDKSKAPPAVFTVSTDIWPVVASFIALTLATETVPSKSTAVLPLFNLLSASITFFPFVPICASSSVIVAILANVAVGINLLNASNAVASASALLVALNVIASFVFTSLRAVTVASVITVVASNVAVNFPVVNFATSLISAGSSLVVSTSVIAPL